MDPRAPRLSGPVLPRCYRQPQNRLEPSGTKSRNEARLRTRRKATRVPYGFPSRQSQLRIRSSASPPRSTIREPPAGQPRSRGYHRPSRSSGGGGGRARHLRHSPPPPPCDAFRVLTSLVPLAVLGSEFCGCSGFRACGRTRSLPRCTVICPPLRPQRPTTPSAVSSSETERSFSPSPHSP